VGLQNDPAYSVTLKRIFLCGVLVVPDVKVHRSYMHFRIRLDGFQKDTYTVYSTFHSTREIVKALDR
jgi:hypothetical protein